MMLLLILMTLHKSALSFPKNPTFLPPHHLFPLLVATESGSPGRILHPPMATEADHEM